jgi:hypothetical protein
MSGSTLRLKARAAIAFTERRKEPASGIESPQTTEIVVYPISGEIVLLDPKAAPDEAPEDLPPPVE